MRNGKHSIDVNMLGGFNITIDGSRVELPYAKAKLVCAILIVEGRPVSRRHIAELLWPLKGNYHAMQNLRQALSVIKRSFASHFHELFHVSKQVIEFVGYEKCNIDCEVVKRAARDPLVCKRHLKEGGVLLLHDVYRGNFCQDIAVPGDSDIERWLSYCRQEYKSYTLGYARKLIEFLKASRQHGQVLELYRLMREIEPYDESLVRECMEFLIGQGCKLQAIGIYREHEKRLHERWGIRPDGYLTGIHESLVDG